MKDSTFEKYKLVIDEYLVNGMNGTKAYQKVYPNATYNTADKGFRDIHDNPRINEYLSLKQADKSNELGITLDYQLKELDELKKLSKESKRYNDSINAIKEQNKLLGFYELHNDQKNPKELRDYSKLTDKELTTLSLLQKKSVINE